MDDLDDALKEWEAKAVVLASVGESGKASLITQIVSRVRTSATSYLAWISEPNAQLKSGMSEKTLRARFHHWEQQGFARKRNGKREYRDFIVPQRQVDAA